MSSREKPILTNRDYPYHDFKKFEDGDEPDSYSVGESNMGLNGDQNKLFVSKSTLIHATQDCTIRFNNAENVAVDIVANNLFTFESNIHAVYILTIGTDGVLRMWFEGMLPEDARRPE